MPERDAKHTPPFHPVRSRPQAEEAMERYVAENPTVRLGSRDESDPWATLGAGEPDVIELPAQGQSLRMATEDLWALSSAHGSWQLRQSDSQSDFLIIEPSFGALSDDAPTEAVAPSHPVASAPPSIPSGPIAAPLPSNSWGARGAILSYDDSLRQFSVEIQSAIEAHLAQGGETLPLARSPETTELVRRLALNYLRNDRTTAEAIGNATDAERLMGAVVDEVLGYGPLDPLLRDESVSEIMVTGAHMTYVEQGGRLHEVPVHFVDDAHLLRVIRKLLQPLGITVTAERPIATARLADGSFVNVVIPPSSISGPSLTIRRFARRAFTLEQLVRLDTMSLHMADFLRLCINARLNIIICGVTGSGKTTLLNALASSIDEQERIVTIEETAELQLHQRHLIRLEVALPNDTRPGIVTKGELLKHALHMRPARIIVGECVGNEALTIIQAMNTGFDGSLATMYANSPRDALARLEALCLSATPAVSPLAVRQQIATGVDLILYCARLRDGTRRILCATDISGMEGDGIGAHDLFVFREAGLDMTTGRIRGEFAATGMRPSFASRIDENPNQPAYFPRGA